MSGIHITPAEPRPSALLDHCETHPDQTVQNSDGGFGLAGGGFGCYYVCGICGNVFGKVVIEDD